MDREQVNMPASQIGFMTIIVEPLYELIHQAINHPLAIEHLQSNREAYRKLKDQNITDLSNVDLALKRM